MPPMYAILSHFSLLDIHNFFFLKILLLPLFSLLNEDPNQNMYQFEQPQFSNSYNKNDINSRSNSDEDKFPFAADIFADETNDIESDDFYGRTREIIIFAEKGNK